MQPPVNAPAPIQQSWTYAALTVLDGHRRLKPAQAAFDRLYFAEPPRLISPQIEIILTNGDAEQRHTALVLPHDPADRRIPIRLLDR